MDTGSTHGKKIQFTEDEYICLEFMGALYKIEPNLTRRIYHDVAAMKVQAFWRKRRRAPCPAMEAAELRCT